MSDGETPLSYSMSEAFQHKPSVCCVMLANGRPGMVKRSIRSFKAQTYKNASLLIFDNGQVRLLECVKDFYEWRVVDYVEAARIFRGEPIGTLRNRANALTSADIICHWDSDDWSHPRRVEEQVALLAGNGYKWDCVGYRDMLFWHSHGPLGGGSQGCRCDHGVCGRQAWLYNNDSQSYCLGTSMCYWRRIWEKRKFEPVMVEEDLRWLNGVRSIGVSAWGEDCSDPRMIATIHGANTTAHIDPQASEWKRVPEWDSHCREVLG